MASLICRRSQECKGENPGGDPWARSALACVRGAPLSGIPKLRAGYRESGASPAHSRALCAAGTLGTEEHEPAGAVDGDGLARRDGLGGAGSSDNRRDAVLARDDCAMRHGAAHFHYQTAGGQEERGPAGSVEGATRISPGSR